MNSNSEPIWLANSDQDKASGKTEKHGDKVYNISSTAIVHGQRSISAHEGDQKVSIQSIE
jgi:hypothetical protein